MAYNQKAKFKNNSPLPCWKGYERVPGTKKGAPGSCRKRSPNKHADESPNKKQKGGGTRKTCLPKAKVMAMSESKRKSLASAKSKAGAKGEYKRPSSTNVKGARKKGATLRDWFEKENWVQVGDPSKKCGEA
tara:strand:- start:807 stop:1202 length:396 start_codon:yes stop_codon:yes gene_type:complete